MKKNSRPKHGLFLGLLFAFCDYLSNVFHNGAVFRFFSSHESERNVFTSSTVARLYLTVKTKCRRYTEAVKKFIARQFERSYMLRLFSNALIRIVSLPGRVVGAFGMTWGAYVVLIFLINRFALSKGSGSYIDLFIGVVALLSSIPLLFTDKALYTLSNESPIISSVLTKVFGVSSDSYRALPQRRIGQSGAVIFGIIAGLLTYFISPVLMVCVAAAIAVIAMVFAYPEGGVVITIAIAPFLGIAEAPSVMLACSVILTAIAYFVKILRGKRVFKVGITGIAVYAFMVAVFLSGFAPGDSNTMENALLCCALMLIFPLIVNLMKNKRWINACVISFVVPAAAVAFIGIAQYLLGLSPGGWIDSTLFSSITSRSVSVFNNPNILGAYLVALFPMALMLTLPKYNKRIRMLGGIASCFIIGATIFTFSRSSWIALLLGGVMFAMFVSPKGILWLIPASCVVVALAVLFPDTFGARLLNIVSLSDSANNYRVAVWNSSWQLLGDCKWFGIGWGEEAFRTAYIKYAADGTQYAVHSHSLFLQVAIQTGIIGLALFIASVISIVRKCFAVTHGSRSGSSDNLCSKAAIAGALSLMIAGIFDYTWYNFRILFIFWALLGFACASVNVRNSEDEYIGYTENDEYSSFLSVPIPKKNTNADAASLKEDETDE